MPTPSLSWTRTTQRWTRRPARLRSSAPAGARRVICGVLQQRATRGGGDGASETLFSVRHCLRSEPSFLARAVETPRGKPLKPRLRVMGAATPALCDGEGCATGDTALTPAPAVTDFEGDAAPAR